MGDRNHHEREYYTGNQGRITLLTPGKFGDIDVENLDIASNRVRASHLFRDFAEKLTTPPTTVPGFFGHHFAVFGSGITAGSLILLGTWGTLAAGTVFGPFITLGYLAYRENTSHKPAARLTLATFTIALLSSFTLALLDSKIPSTTKNFIETTVEENFQINRVPQPPEIK